MSQTLTISTKDGNFSAYLATPSTSPAPGLVLMQEIFGVNQNMREIADRYAQLGYLTIVPDLFWRQEPGVELMGNTPEELNKAFQLYEGFDENKGVEDLIATLEHLQSLPQCNGKIGTLGFCLGGKLAYLMATRSPSACNVGYYGVGIENNLEEATAIKAPTILHFADNDRFVPPEAQAQIKTQLANHAFITIYSYKDVEHGFARLGSDNYAPEAATTANDRTRQFLQQHLT